MNFSQSRCILCHTVLMLSHHGLCSKCNATITRFIYCGRCGSTLAHHATSCGNCLQNDPHWNQMVIVGRYVPPLSTLIHQFKFKNQFWLDKTLARLLLLEIYHARRVYQTQLPQVLIPVPLHHLRQWKRGYNQAALLGNYLSHWLNIPLEQNLVIRQKNTSTQRGLDKKARTKNIKNAFMLNPKILKKLKKCGQKSIAIIDDVITTGATVNEISIQLRQAGITSIQIWGIAKT